MNTPSGREAAMRVLFVLPRMVAGGVERVTLNLIDGLQRQGVECSLALGHCRGELLAEAQRLTCVHEVAGRGNAFFMAGLLPVLRRYQPTHVVTAFADVGLMTWLACRLARSQAVVVMGVHGTLGEAAALGGWRVRLQYRLHGWLAGIVYRRCSAVVAVSEGVARDVAERHPRVVPRLAVIHNPVVTAAMREHLSRLPGAVRLEKVAPFHLVAVGRLAHEKGFDVLLRAMPDIASRHAVRLTIYGEGIEHSRLHALVESLGLRHVVRLAGNAPDPLVAMAGADLFVFPSRHEGFGMALVEAMACGLQVVACDCPHGPGEILQWGRFGQLVPPEDPAALAAAVDRCLAGEVRFDPQAVRRRAGDFSADMAVAAYLDLLRGLRFNDPAGEIR